MGEDGTPNDSSFTRTKVLNIHNGITIGHIMLLFCTVICLTYYFIFHILIFKKKLNMLVKFWIFYLLWQIGQCVTSISFYEKAYDGVKGLRSFLWYAQWVINSAQASILLGMSVTIILSVKGFLENDEKYYVLIGKLYKYFVAPVGILNLILIFAVPYGVANIVSYIYITLADLTLIGGMAYLTDKFRKNDKLFYKTNDSNKKVQMKLLLLIVSIGLGIGFIGFQLSALARGIAGFCLAFLGYFHFVPLTFGLYYIQKINCFKSGIILKELANMSN